MSDTTDEETREAESPEDEQPFRVRDVFAFRRPKSEAEYAEEPEEAPEAAPAATIPQQPKTLGIGDRAPNWWEPKPVIAAACQHPNPHEVRAKPTGQLVAFWCADCETQLDVPEDYDELEDVAKEGGNGEGDGQAPAAVRRRWGVRGTGEKTYKRPVYGKDSTAQKKALIEAFTGLSPKAKHLLYNGTALGAGFWIGVPQFFTDEVAYLAATYDSWTEFYVVIWYGVALAIALLDFRTRGWFPLFAWTARIPLVSMIIGVLLYGTPAA
ncbi:hypothetical protein EES44_24535 [Streptomyces sp. ADI96-15]|uniref:hypothetical protein n=1 Tax=Streptomyces sp. ADI96-15 TaxID=1522761 RepID=UPI000F55673C|nr:hypothetical protein [Streptomyces sp. ADI96-15]RPK58103.1 hypothetical protein EES44_24535 [Streptomyces sp. ADI96-15]